MPSSPIRIHPAPTARPAAPEPVVPGDVADAVRVAIAAHGSLDGALLPVLHAVQERLGCVPNTAIAPIAEALRLSRAEVHGVIGYYHHFRREPAGRRVVQVCRAESCRSLGGEALLAAARARARCSEAAPTSADGAWTVEPVYCLGLCAASPAATVDGRLLGRLTARSLTAAMALAGPAAPRAPCASREAGDASRAVTTLSVPCDSAAVALGANAVADAIEAEAASRGLAVEVRRTSSRGLFWLEPLVEIDTAEGRVAFGHATAADAATLLDAAVDARAGRAPARIGLGRVDALPFLRAQQRLTFARAGITRPLSLADYAAHGGWAGLRAAVAVAPEAVRAEVLASGLRGRGGAAFPAGIKWRTVAKAASAQTFVVCNADEGDSGTYADRMLMEGDPFLLIEGMAIAAIACGATKGFVYVRSEYPDAVRVLSDAIALARDAGFLGTDVAGSGRAFELEVRLGAGSYVCGEETAMLESLEGRRGIVRAKPPLPALQGLFGRPTLIQNVLTFAAVPTILARGAAFYRDFGQGRSTGTLPFQLAGNVARPGLVELGFGVTLRELVFGFGGGSASGRAVKAIQVGGPLGAYLPEARWDVPLDYEAYAAIGAAVGHGGIVVHDDTADLAALARYAMEFCAVESCGKCTPCRIGSTRGVEVVDRILAAADDAARDRETELLRDLCDTMTHGSLCAMGGMTPYPVLSALDHFPVDFGLAATKALA